MLKRQLYPEIYKYIDQTVRGTDLWLFLLQQKMDLINEFIITFLQYSILRLYTYLRSMSTASQNWKGPNSNYVEIILLIFLHSENPKISNKPPINTTPKIERVKIALSKLYIHIKNTYAALLLGILYIYLSTWRSCGVEWLIWKSCGAYMYFVVYRLSAVHTKLKLGSSSRSK